MKVLNKLDSLDNINDGETRKLPTKTSQLTNDSGYITSADVPTKTSELTNDSNFITNTGSTSGNAGTATTLQTYAYNRNNSTNTWFKVATTTITKQASQWPERHAFLFIKGSHNSNYNQNGIIAIDAVGNGQSGKIGSYNAQFMSATQDLNLENFYIEFLHGDSETDGIVNFWIRANTNNYASWQVKILQNTGWTIANSSATATTMPSTNYTGKNAILAGFSARSTGDKNGDDITTTYYKASNPNGYTSNTGTITKVQANGTDVASSGTANIPAASTSAYGVTKLSDATNSTSTTLAATPSAVKAAFDNASNKLEKTYTNGTVEGHAEWVNQEGDDTFAIDIYNSNSENYAFTTYIPGYIEMGVNGVSLNLSPESFSLSTTFNSDTSTLHGIFMNSVNQQLRITDVRTPTDDCDAANKKYVDDKVAATTDTKNTAGSTDTSSKIFLIGATSQAANPQTYSDNEVYATSGVLTTKSVQVGGTAATMQYNSTDKCIEFVFS